MLLLERVPSDAAGTAVLELFVGIHVALLVHQKSFENPFPVCISIYMHIFIFSMQI